MHIFKNYVSQNNKGILILSHNEILKYNIHKKLSDDIKKKYYLVQYNGGFRVPIKLKTFLDPERGEQQFGCNNLLSNDFTYKFVPKKVYEYFKYICNLHNIKTPELNINYKPIDFLYVGRIVPIKTPYKILNNFVSLASKGYISVFLILKQIPTTNYYKDFLKKYNSLDDKIKSKIIIFDTHNIKINNNPYYFGLNRYDVSIFYKMSKVYVHGCLVEGGSRTIHEAIACGCVISAPQELKGGGLLNLPKDGYKLFKFSSNWENVLLECLKISELYKCTENNLKNIIVKYKFPELCNYLKTKLNIQTDLKTLINLCDNSLLDLKFAAHYLCCPWYDKTQPTANILNNKQLKIFESIVGLPSVKIWDIIIYLPDDEKKVNKFKTSLQQDYIFMHIVKYLIDNNFVNCNILEYGFDIGNNCSSLSIYTNNKVYSIDSCIDNINFLKKIKELNNIKNLVIFEHKDNILSEKDKINDVSLLYLNTEFSKVSFLKENIIFLTKYKPIIIWKNLHTTDKSICEELNKLNYTSFIIYSDNVEIHYFISIQTSNIKNLKHFINNKKLIVYKDLKHS